MPRLAPQNSRSLSPCCWYSPARPTTGSSSRATCPATPRMRSISIASARWRSRLFPATSRASIEVEQVGDVHVPRHRRSSPATAGATLAPRVLVSTDLSGRLDHRRHRVDARRWAAASSRASTPQRYGRMQAAMSTASADRDHSRAHGSHRRADGAQPISRPCCRRRD